MARSTLRRVVAVLFAGLGLLSAFSAGAESLPQPTESRS